MREDYPHTPGRDVRAADHASAPRPSRARRTAVALLCLTFLLTWAWPASPALADDAAETGGAGDSGGVEGRSTLPLADPVVVADAQLSTRRASSWSEGDVRMLLLEGDVTIAVGTYGFRADHAVVRIDEERSGGRLIRHLAIYLDNARTLQGRGPTQVEAPRLLVTASTTGQVDLSTDLLRENSEAGDPLVLDATERIGKYLAGLRQPLLDVPEGPPLHPSRPLTVRPSGVRPPPTQISPLPKAFQKAEPRVVAKVEPGAGEAPLPAPPQVDPAPPGPVDAGRVLPSAGVVSFSVKKAVYLKADAVLVLIGKVHVVYHGTADRQGMSLSAENAVIFLSEDPGVGNQVDASAVKGIYLEENVVARYGDYTVRAPRVFYDLEHDRAVVLDAVMYTWDVKRQIPIYVRAAKLMQRSKSAWQADRALLTTSEFAEPHFAIAAAQVTVTQGRRPDGSVGSRFVSRDNQLRWGKLPVFYWPRLAGEVQSLPIRRLTGTYSSNNGPLVHSKWDMFALAGKEKPAGVDLSGDLDFLGEHGPAVGAEFDYDRPDMKGELEGYVVVQDDGDDEISGRNAIDHDGDTRGYVKGQHRQYLNDGWELSAELAFVSDETFLEEFFRSEAESAKPYETSLYLKKQERDWAVTLLTRYDLNDFTAQTTTLQAPGYNVDKLPEAGYWRIGTGLWDDRLTYYSQNHATRMRIRPGEESPGDRGFNAAMSAMLFGTGPAVPFDMAPGTAAIDSGNVGRFDSRHELQAPLKVSFLNVVPYVTGRVTAYDDDTFSAMDEDNIRYWGAAGTRVHTQFSRTFDKAASSLLDVHRLRHVVEPSVDVFASDTSLDGTDLAVFDPDVEGINQGWGAIFGLRNTLQTQRGGQGRWRTVDWLVLDTRLAYRGDEEPHGMVIPRYYGYRPEYSLGGDHANGELMWMVSDTLAAVAELTYDLDADVTSQWRVGMSLDHSPQLTLHADFTELDILSSRLLSYGFDYRMTTKYTVRFDHRLDLSTSGDRSIDVALIRQLPRWKLVVLARIDELDDEETIGIVLIPDGIGGSRYRPVLSGQPLF